MKLSRAAGWCLLCGTIGACGSGGTGQVGTNPDSRGPFAWNGTAGPFAVDGPLGPFAAGSNPGPFAGSGDPGPFSNTGGSATCEGVCANAVGVKCDVQQTPGTGGDPGTSQLNDPVVACLVGCEVLLESTPAPCAGLLSAYFTCAASASFLCDNGDLEIVGCEDQSKAFNACRREYRQPENQDTGSAGGTRP